MAGTGKGKPRQRWGHLHDAVLRLLRDRVHPLSGLELTEMLRGEGQGVPPSMVFRAIRGLVGRGAIRKILVARAYVLAPEGDAISLYCRACGALHGIADADTFASLDRAAAARGFTVARHIVEVPGLCRDCAEAGRTTT